MSGNNVCSSRGITRRGFLSVAVSAVVAGVVAGVGAYYAGSLTAPVKEIVKEVTRTVTSTTTLAPGAPVTTTVTVTAPPTTVTKTVTTTITATTTPTGAPEAILIGVDTPLSGAMAEHGRDVLVMYEFIVEEINAEGGIYVKEYGRKIPVKLITYDNKSDPSTAVSNIIRLATYDKVHFALTGPGTFLHVAIAPEAEKHQLLCIGIGMGTETIHERGYKWYFSHFSRHRQYPDALFGYLNSLPEKERPKGVAIWQENTEEGESFAGWFRQKTPTYGYRIVFDSLYTQRSTDYSDLILKSKAAGAEIVVAVNTTPDAILMTKQMAELGYKPKVVYFQRGADPESFYEALGKLAEGVIGIGDWNYDYPIEGNDAITTYYRRTTGKKIPSSMAGSGYASVQILRQSIEKAGSLDKEKVRQALLSETFKTIKGPIKFDEAGKSWGIVHIHQWQRGLLPTVWPKEVATAAFLYPYPGG